MQKRRRQAHGRPREHHRAWQAVHAHARHAHRRPLLLLQMLLLLLMLIMLLLLLLALHMLLLALHLGLGMVRRRRPQRRPWPPRRRPRRSGLVRPLHAGAAWRRQSQHGLLSWAGLHLLLRPLRLGLLLFRSASNQVTT